MTLSPAIDVAILKRVCDAYAELCMRSSDCEVYDVCAALPNGGLPLIRDKLLVEYPTETG